MVQPHDETVIPADLANFRVIQSQRLQGNVNVEFVNVICIVKRRLPIQRKLSKRVNHAVPDLDLVKLYLRGLQAAPQNPQIIHLKLSLQKLQICEREIIIRQMLPALPRLIMLRLPNFLRRLVKRGAGGGLWAF